MVESNESKLLTVAESISDGARVDWGAVPAADEHDSRVLQELRLLDRIAAFHRADEPSSLPTASLDRRSSDRAADTGTTDRPLTAWGHLTIVDEIGQGTFGVVYRARDAKLQSDVALKLLRPADPATSFDPAHTFDEARRLARLRHPNVVKVFGVDEIDGRVGFWMEFVNGRTLAQWLRTHGPFSAREAALIGLDVCRALAAVHVAGLLHGDVKAHNVMREEGGRTVLMDFGTGKDLALDPLRGGDDFAGTPLYLAPEVFAGRRRTKATDIYSLGVLLYHLVTDSYPVEGRTCEEVALAHQRKQQKPLRDVRPDLPEEFVQIVERALAADPRDRHSSAGAFGVALGRFLGAASSVDPMWLVWLKSHVRQVMAVSVTVAALIIGVAYWAGRPWPRDRTAIPVRPVAAGAEQVTPGVQGAAATESYRIEAALYRELDGRQVRLQSHSRVEPGAKLFAEVRSSVPTYLYVVNEDESGASYLLYPLPDQVSNPLPPSVSIRLPKGYDWQVDKAGGREHFIIFASPQPLGDFEQRMFAMLPRPQAGTPVQSVALSGDAMSRLRSVGALFSVGSVTKPSKTERSGLLTQMFATPLTDKEETTTGVWVRQLTLENPR